MSTATQVALIWSTMHHGCAGGVGGLRMVSKPQQIVECGHSCQTSLLGGWCFSVPACKALAQARSTAPPALLALPAVLQGGLGPMQGQADWFVVFAPEKNEMAIERYLKVRAAFQKITKLLCVCGGVRAWPAGASMFQVEGRPGGWG